MKPGAGSQRHEPTGGDDQRMSARSYLLIGGILLALAGLFAWLLWPRDGGPPQTERFVTEIEMLQPPPPPEPEMEDPIMEEEEDILEPSEEPPSETPNEEPVDQPQDSPSEPSDANQLAGLDRPADAGSDNFRLAAGGGGGLFGRGSGGGGGGGDWGGYVESHIRRALQRDPRTRAARGSLRVEVTITADGRFSRATLRSSTGNPDLDKAVQDVLQNMPRLGTARPANTSAQTFATIDMRRL
ncbi:energy transducer TonB family protein [Pelagerythrobacter marensis]|uniref:Energy transducer TonB n=1 Tax=Pelagerythrobacter marensis TaxID=543877 RepID=A0A0G3XBJ8_9SPHN|nr:energy transducer TonB [Pelagerythrobacter marensis]AKM07753.1 hypothetical protein AM2010_1687 [Pelagerythrobacter marensis]